MLGWVVRVCFLEEVGYSWALGNEKPVDNHSHRYWLLNSEHHAWSFLCMLASPSHSPVR